MNILIVGAGKVGSTLAAYLSQEDHDITIIDNDEDVIQQINDTLDVMCIKGPGAAPSVLREAGAKEADLVLATTNMDEVNMLCALTAKRLGAKYTIARIRDVAYTEDLASLQKDLAIDAVINPEYATALIALCATLIFGILPVKQWRNNVAWESLIFIACSVGLGTVLPHVNITTWLSEAVGPYTVGFFSNPFLLIAGLAVLTLLVRFLILSEIGYLSVFTALLIPLGISAGINPWIIGFILNAFVIGWFLPYQSSVYLTAIYAAGEGWVTIKDTTKYCYVYCIIGLVCMYIAYFLWNLMGIWSIA